MAREERLIRERALREKPPYPILNTDHLVHIKDTMINILRDIFSRDPEFTYIREVDGILPDFENPNLGLVITDVYSYEVEFIPAITVRVNNSNLTPVSFNQNQGTFDYLRNEDGSLAKDAYGKPIPIYEEFAGLYKSSVTLLITTWTPLDREKLIAKVAIIFKHLLRDQLYADFGLFVESVNVGGEQELAYSNDHLFSQAVTVDVLTSWTNRIPTTDEVVEGINLQIVGDAARPVEGKDDPRRAPDCTRATPTKRELEESTRMDWVDTIYPTPELFLEDAIEFRDVAGSPEAFVTQDWLNVLDSIGVTIEDAIIAINGQPSIRERLIEHAKESRMTATKARKSVSSGVVKGNPGDGFTVKTKHGTVGPDATVYLPDGTVIQPDDTVITGTLSSSSPEYQITPSNDVIVPIGADSNPVVDIDAGSKPFTAMSLDDLDAFNFFMIILFMETTAAQSPRGLNKLIDEFVATLTDANQITNMEDIRTQVNAIVQSRLLRGRNYNFDSLNS